MEPYNYTECGLDNVWIYGVQPVIDDAGEETVKLPKVAALHRTLAYAVITSEHGMTPKALRFLRTEIGLTQAELAAFVKKDHQTIGRWERGEKPIDQNAECMIRMLAAEKLELKPGLSVEEMAQRCVPEARIEIINIDGSVPGDYKLMAA